MADEVADYTTEVVILTLCLDINLAQWEKQDESTGVHNCLSRSPYMYVSHNRLRPSNSDRMCYLERQGDRTYTEVTSPVPPRPTFRTLVLLVVNAVRME